jgi:hypothetical protein
VRGGGFGAEPHAGAESLEVRQLGGIARQPAGGQPLTQGGLV